MSKNVDKQSEQNNKNVEEVIGNSSESKDIDNKEKLISNLGVEIQGLRLEPLTNSENKTQYLITIGQSVRCGPTEDVPFIAQSSRKSER